MIDGEETIEVRSCLNSQSKKGTIRRTGKNTYIVIKSNEERHFKTETTEQERNVAIARKLIKLRDIIRTNTHSGIDMVATVTYSETVDDYKVVQNDIEQCIRRLRRKHNIEYIAVPELQLCGRWHVHIIIIMVDDADTIKREELYKAWRRGGVHINAVRNANAVALYLTMCGGGKGTLRRKYPSGMRLYRCSKGVVRPNSVIMNGEDINKLVDGYDIVYRRCYQISGVYWGSKTVYDKTRAED